MSEPIQPFLDKFDEIDKKKKGALDLASFKQLFPQIMGGNPTDEMAEMYFTGIDIDNSGQVSRDEYEEFVQANLDQDETYLIKMAFRSFDKDRSNSLDSSEIKAISRYIGREMTDDQISAAMQSYTGKKSGTLSFAQIVKMITGKDIPEDTDPYDGKLGKSKCCLLL